jgi:hypothetical protein
MPEIKRMSLPTFLIVGERKSGTTALCRWLVHPDVYMHPLEDMNYFIEDEILATTVWRDGEVDSERWERTHSPEHYAELFKAAPSGVAIAEKSADLFFWKPAHERIARFLPDCKFIVVLRQPVQRAWSHYLDELAKGEGRESLPFDEALAREEQRAQGSAYARLHLSYRERGCYDRSARSFLGHVAPSRVFFLTLEQMRKAPRESLRDVYRFIGVDPDVGLELAGTRHNEGGGTKISRPWTRSPALEPLARAYHRAAAGIAERLVTDGTQRQQFKDFVYRPIRRSGRAMVMSERAREHLARSYRTHVDALGSLLGREFGDWRLDE